MRIASYDFSKKTAVKNLILFGAGEIAVRTAKKLTTSFHVVDNSQPLWGSRSNELGVVQKPSIVADLFDECIVIICSSSVLDIAQQLREFGVPEDRITQSPYVKDLVPVAALEEATISLLVTSGGPEGNREVGGGGVYRIDIAGPEVNVVRVLNASSHGLAMAPTGNHLVTTDRGIFSISSSGGADLFAEIPDGARPHGIGWSEVRNSFLVVNSRADALLEYSEVGTYLGSHDLGQPVAPGGLGHHHMNDLLILGETVFVSMFSISGNWRKGVFDGGVVGFDVEGLGRQEVAISNLQMPHSPVHYDYSMSVCDSLRGILRNGAGDADLAFPGFIRGLAMNDDFKAVGSSRNRNSTDLTLGRRTLIQEISSGIHLLTHHANHSRFIPMPGGTPEIHAVAFV